MRSLIKFSALICLSIWCGSVLAQAEAEYVYASQEMEKSIAQEAERGLMPRLMQNKAAGLIAILSDSERFLEARKYQINDLESLMGICNRANRIVMSYALFGLKDHVKPNADPVQAKLQLVKLMERNLVAFQGELEKLQPFLIRCMAKEVPILAEFAAALKPNEFTDTRKAGLRQAQNGLFNLYLGALQSINCDGLRAAYQAQLIMALSETSQSFASALPMSSRTLISSMTKDVKYGAPSRFHEDLEEIIDSMDSPVCIGLCKL